MNFIDTRIAKWPSFFAVQNSRSKKVNFFTLSFYFSHFKATFLSIRVELFYFRFSIYFGKKEEKNIDLCSKSGRRDEKGLFAFRSNFVVFQFFGNVWQERITFIDSFEAFHSPQKRCAFEKIAWSNCFKKQTPFKK